MIDFSKDYPKVTESSTVIRFQDCDPLRHLNNAKYFDYFFNAREDQVWLLYGIRPGDIFQKYGAGWVVYQHQISYVRPANVGEWVTIFSRIIFCDHDTVVVEYVMADSSKQQLKTLLWTTMKYIEVRTGQKTRHHEEVMAYLQKILYPGVNYPEESFATRVKHVKQQLAGL
jgi:acyl-CoA thioester hydrolase